MRHLLSIAVAVLAACSSGEGAPWPGVAGDPALPAEDHSGAFLGTWSGTLTGTAGGDPIEPEAGSARITRVGHNRLSVAGVCPDESAVTAFVLGPDTLSVKPGSCPAVAVDGCSAVTVTFGRGSGTLASGTLSLSLEGSMAGCGRSFPIALSFTATRSAPRPTLASLSPSGAVAGAPGFELTVTGTGFAAASSVVWNGSPRPTTYVSETELRAAIAPADVAVGGYVPVSVSTPGGGASDPATFVVTNPAPAVSSLTPDTVLAGSGGASLTVSGSGFVPTSVVAWNGSARPTTFVSSTTVQATLTAADLSVAGAGAVTVASPEPGGGTSAPATLRVENPVPAVTGLSPGAVVPGAPRFTLTVTGSGFGAGTVVRWNGAPRPTTVVSSGVLHAAIDPEDVATAGGSDVSVHSPPPGGGTAAAGPVTIAEAPPRAPEAVAYQIDPAHSGRATLGAPLAFPDAPAWSVTLPGAVSYPLVAGGKAFVLTRGSASGGYGTQLHALDLASGAMAWGPVAIDGTYFWAGHAYEDGTVFVVSLDGVLRSFDAGTGAPGWSVETQQGWVTSPPTALDGVVYVGGGGAVAAYDAIDGTRRWSQAVAGGDHSSPALAPDGVFVSYACDVYKLDLLSGSPIWRDGRACSGGGGKTAAYAGGRVYVRGTYLEPVGSVHDAFDGSVIGRFGPSLTAMPPPAIGASAAFLVTGGALQRRDLVAETVAWTFGGDGQLRSAPIVIDDDVVVVGSGSGTVFAVDAATGAQLWSGAAGAPIAAPDEHNVSQPYTGLAAGEGYLLVPAGTRLTAWRITSD